MCMSVGSMHGWRTRNKSSLSSADSICEARPSMVTVLLCCAVNVGNRDLKELESGLLVPSQCHVAGTQHLKTFSVLFDFTLVLFDPKPP